MHSIRNTIFLVVFACGMGKTKCDETFAHTISRMWQSYLLSENGLRLTAKSLLFTIVTTSALSGFTFLGLLVLGHLVQFVAFAFFAECTALFRYVNLSIRKDLYLLRDTNYIARNTWVDTHNLNNICYKITTEKCLLMENLEHLRVMCVFIVHDSLIGAVMGNFIYILNVYSPFSVLYLMTVYNRKKMYRREQCC